MTPRIKSFEEYEQVYQRSVDDPEGFWAEMASHFSWRKKWDKTLEWNFSEPDVKWFVNGKLNITENALDRHLASHGHMPAIVFEPNDPAEAHQILTYSQLHVQVCRMANALKNYGVEKGDRVILYMPMIHAN